MSQTDVEHGSEHAVPHHPVLRADGVLIGAELLEAVLQKRLQPTIGLVVIDRVRESPPGPNQRQMLCIQLVTGLINA